MCVCVCRFVCIDAGSSNFVYVVTLDYVSNKLCFVIIRHIKDTANNAVQDCPLQAGVSSSNDAKVQGELF